MTDHDDLDAVERRLLKVAADRPVKELADAARRRALEIINRPRPEAEQHAHSNNRH